MNKWFFEPIGLEEAIVITPFYIEDNRGGFVKDYSKEVFEANGISHELKEVFYTISQKGVLRGIHFQKIKQQAKLVRCIKGKIFDVVVDLRRDSSTYMKWKGIILSDKNNKQIYVPKGFGHGYLVLEDSIVSYKCNEKFYSNYDDGIKYDDKDLKIKWPYDLIGGKEKIILSNKDLNLQSFNYFNNIVNDF